MYDIEDLISRLANGETEEALAAEMTNSLNEAIAAAKERKEEERKRNEAAKAAAHTEAAKVCARNIILTISDYYNAIGEDELADNILNTSPEEVDKMAAMFESITSLTKMINNFVLGDTPKTESNKNNTTAKKSAPKLSSEDADWAEEQIRKFLNSLN